ncbi:MAG: hypothetical protein KH828_06045 [Clostridiales bacterium]|nr:hypothetical protein [Clostridiales bacterium]
MNKTKIDLITGFLGAGKTTFIRKYLQACSKKGEHVIVIENEFGKAGIDMAILEREQIEVTQLAGGCICCGLKVNFHDLLIDLSHHYDRILVEPSGIYTLEDFYEIMESPSVAEVCEVGSILMIADPEQLKELDSEAAKIVYSQAAGAGQIIVSKVGIQQIEREETVRLLQEILTSHQNFQRNISDYLLFCDWEKLTEEDFLSFRSCGYYRNRNSLPKQDHSTLFYNTTISPRFPTEEKMLRFLKEIWNGTCGEIIRVKGYLKLADGCCYEINCTSRDWSVKETADIPEEGLNLIGSKINRKQINLLAR